MNKLELLNQWVGQLSIEKIRNLPEEELLNFVMERPGHPGSFGFMFPMARFTSDNNFSTIFCELMKRLGKVENVKEKMRILRPNLRVYNKYMKNQPTEFKPKSATFKFLWKFFPQFTISFILYLQRMMKGRRSKGDNIRYHF